MQSKRCDTKCNSMNAFSAVSHAMNISPSSYTPSRNLVKIPNHWAWDLYSYLFTTLFGALAVICAVAFIRQWMQASPSRNMYGRFTTVQLFLAATLKVIGHLCTPTFLGDATTEIFLASLLIETFSKALLLICVQYSASHTSRNNKDFIGRSKAPKHLDVAWHNGCFSRSPAYIKLASPVRKSRNLVFNCQLRCFHLGISNLHRIYCRRI